MSLGNAILVTVFFADAFATIQYPHLSSYSPPLWSFDTDAKQFGLAIRSSSGPEWYHAGMQLFAFKHIGTRWNKKNITWGIERHSKILDKKTAIDMIAEAFGMWSAESSLNITGPVSKPDIRIKFDPELRAVFRCTMEFLPGGRYEKRMYIADSKGARIFISDDIKPTDPENDAWRARMKNGLLRQIGHTLGLDISPLPDAVMSNRYDHYKLKDDDIDGIRSLYGPPQSDESSSG